MKGKLGTLKITAKEDESVEETGPDGQRLREEGRTLVIALSILSFVS